jgi:hypothetical protein
MVMVKRRKRSRNIKKQEAVVSALWNFAADITKRGLEGTQCANVRLGVSVSLKHIGTALGSIMDIFGYDVAEVQ